MSTDVKEDVIQATKTMLGKYIKKPQLTDKLLKKPPFRFLHDIVVNIIKETGLFKGLYSDKELISENVAERDVKTTFLNKLIDATKAISGIELAVKSSKVIAGLEPAETNFLLQAIATIVDKKIDSTEYVASIVSQNNPAQNKDNVKKAKEKKTATVSKTKTLTPRLKNQENVNLKTREKGKTDKEPSKPPKNLDNSKKTKHSKTRETKVPTTINVSESNPIQSDRGNNERQKSKTKLPAQVNPNEANPIKSDKGSNERKPSFQNENDESLTIDMPKSVLLNKTEHEKKLHYNTVTPNNEALHEKELIFEPPAENVTESLEQIIENSGQRVQNRPKSAKPSSSSVKKERVIIANELEKTAEYSVPDTRPKTSLRPPSVRPTSARPGAPRVRTESIVPVDEVVHLGKISVIVENYDKNDSDDDEKVVKQTVTEPEFMVPSFDIPSDKGHLVEQILQQIEEDNIVDQAKPKVGVEWGPEGLGNKHTIGKQIQLLRGDIQTSTRTANPLSKLINYLHEDVDAMYTEFDTWTNLKRQSINDINTQIRIFEESYKPLQNQMDDIQENLKKHQKLIVSIHATISSNESRINSLLK